jgi:hypothetical protein
MGIPTRFTVGPSSGTHTASPTASRLGVYMIAGGGNGAPGSQPMCSPFVPGPPGGQGGFGFYNAPIAQPFSQPFAVAGSAGNTNLTNVGTVNAGTPGAGGSAAGNAPGASLTYPNASFVVGGAYGAGFPGPSSGAPGVLVIFENIGT